MTCVRVLESGNLASIFAVIGYRFSLVPSLMYVFRGLFSLSNKNLSVLPPTFNACFRARFSNSVFFYAANSSLWRII